MLEIATFGAGCFWCIEACFLGVTGIVVVTPGYMGGQTTNPTYEEICTGTTGHAEVAQVTFDPNVIPYDQLLKLFWFVHDPTQLNRQGNDIGTQYRSVIFYHNDDQKEIAENQKHVLDDAGMYPKPIVTQIVPVETFYEAEEYHKNYMERNPENPYCQFVVRPKLEKFNALFKN